MMTLSRFLLCVTTLLLSVSAFADDDAKLREVRSKVASMFDVIEPKHVTGSPVDGWYTIQKGAIVAYISGDGRYMLQGDLIDLDENVNVSERARNNSRQMLMSGLPENKVITFSPDEKKYSISIFTDIECTYCRRLHAQIDDYLEQGIEVRYLLYPRNGPRSRSWNTSEEVWCSADRQAALTSAKLDRDFETASCDDASMIEDHYAMGREIGLSGTPAIILEDGELISGYLPAAALKQRLELKSVTP